MIAQDLALIELQGLVRTCRDSRDAFRYAAQSGVSPSLAAELMSFGDQRHDFALAMQQTLSSLGLEALDAAGERSRLQRFRADAVEDADVLVKCQRLEARATEEYAAAGQDEWPSSVHEMLATHLRAFRLGEKRVRLMRIAIDSL